MLILVFYGKDSHEKLRYWNEKENVATISLILNTHKIQFHIDKRENKSKSDLH